MIKKSLFSFLFFILFSANLGYSQNFGIKTIKSSNQELTVSIEDLYFNGQDIYILSDGKAFSITSLKKSPNGWEAQIDSGMPWCPMGHAACPDCDNCHNSECPFYVQNCGR